jgi:hypothetical protein
MPPVVNQPKNFPWSGKIVPWSAALRSKPSKESHTLADLPRGQNVRVIHTVQGWLYVELNPGGKRTLKGYVSRELIKPEVVSTAKAAANGSVGTYKNTLRTSSAPLSTPPKLAPHIQRTPEDWKFIARQRAFGWELAREISAGNAWDPTKGFAASKHIIADVYDYYGALYRRNPKKFQWAGLARMAGGPFYKGFCDMEDARQAVVAILKLKHGALREGVLMEAVVDVASQIVFGPLGVVMGPARDETIDIALQHAATHLGQALEHLMVMGKNIFGDLAWQHEAYHELGLSEIKRFADLNQLGVGYYEAWKKIDSGDPQKIWEGNCKLLWYEQHDIIARGYAKLQKMVFVPTAMSALAQSPHPWGEPFYAYYDAPPGIPPLLKSPSLVPVLTRDVTRFNDRWGWLENNIWLTWKAHSEAQRTSLINRSLADLGLRKFY